MGNSNAFIQTSTVSIHPVNVFTRHFPNFDTSLGVYITSVNRIRFSNYESIDYLFRFDSKIGSQYLSSSIFYKLGYTFKLLDDCIVQVNYGGESQLVMCPPLELDNTELVSTADSLPEFSVFDSES